MIETIEKHRQDFNSRIHSSSESLKQLRIEFLGKKGCIQALMKDLRQASPDEKRQLGKLINDFKQYVQNLLEEREQELNIPIYNDMGQAIGKSMDYSAAKFDVRIVAGSTLPVNRWAYLAELKELLQFGVIDDIAVLAETDVRNKEQIAKRKSLYSQLQGQLGQLQEAVKDKEGTIETLERQLVQAGIKGKVMQAEMEITKKKEEVKGDLKDSYRSTDAKQKLLQNVMSNEVDSSKKDLSREVQFAKKELQSNNKNK